MEWSNTMTLNFLDIYQKEPVIWDPSHKLHKNRNEVFDAWKRIQNEFSSDVSIEELKKKKDSLMATFRNCKSKIKASERTGTGRSDLYKPNWFAFEKMAGFLMYHDTPKKTINSENIEIDGTETQSQSTIEFRETPDRDPPNETVTLLEDTPSNAPAIKKKKVQTRDHIIYAKMESAYNMLTTHSAPKPATERSECTIYRELIAKRLEAMEPNARDYVMHAIDNVMYEAKMRFDKNTFSCLQSNSRISHFTTSSPAFSQASHSSNTQYSNPSSVETYTSQHHTLPSPQPNTHPLSQTPSSSFAPASQNSTNNDTQASIPSLVELYTERSNAKDYYETFA